MLRNVRPDGNLSGLTCPSCGRTGVLRRHGSYTRHLATEEGEGPIRIRRARCRACSSTHALLPPGVVPRMLHSESVHLAVAAAWAQGTTARSVRESLRMPETTRRRVLGRARAALCALLSCPPGRGAAPPRHRGRAPAAHPHGTPATQPGVYRAREPAHTLASRARKAARTTGRRLITVGKRTKRKIEAARAAQVTTWVAETLRLVRGGKAGSAYLHVVADGASGRIIAARCSERGGASALLEALRCAVDAEGAPKRLLADNGPLAGGRLADACAELGIRLEAEAVPLPARGHIERMLRSHLPLAQGPGPSEEGEVAP